MPENSDDYCAPCFEALDWVDKNILPPSESEYESEEEEMEEGYICPNVTVTDSSASEEDSDDYSYATTESSEDVSYMSDSSDDDDDDGDYPVYSKGHAGYDRNGRWRDCNGRYATPP